MSILITLKLHNFRSYDDVALGGLSAGLVVLYGANGAGKTNILEAISLLSPGRGVRGAKTSDVQRIGSSDPWAVAAQLQTKYEAVRLGTGLDPASKEGSERRIVRIDGQTVRSQSSLAKYLSCIWLTPQMDRLFLDSSRERRKFLDRLVFSFDPGHSGRVTRYENALSQRSKLLKEGMRDEAWLSGLEKQMAETGIAIAAARLDFVQRLQVACNAADHVYFPLARLGVCGNLEGLLSNAPALEVEGAFLQQLSESRERDAIVGGALHGPHKSDLSVVYSEKGMPAEQCSTGEQKALLVGIVLAHARLINAERGFPPIILLDEIAAHLDEGRRNVLYDILQDLGGQVWLTGADRSLFDSIKGQDQFYEVNDGRILRS